MSIDKLTVTIWFERDRRSAVVDELFSHMSSWKNSKDGYAVPFASWEDVSRKLALLDSLAGSIAEAIRFADKGKGPAEANISAMDMVDIEACLDELTPG
ncbi:hypothetical protein [Zymobacter sp. IVIA_12111.31 C1]|uniref:hypothetical protein n=1 Tax=Zymobacter sp. IVIA_12111.31 C1 TaxID=3394854 RepID=UPI0039C4ADB1